MANETLKFQNGMRIVGGQLLPPRLRPRIGPDKIGRDGRVPKNIRDPEITFGMYRRSGQVLHPTLMGMPIYDQAPTKKIFPEKQVAVHPGMTSAPDRGHEGDSRAVFECAARLGRPKQ